MYFRSTGWHFVGIPAGRSVSEEISNHKSSIHWLLTLDQKYNFPNFPYKELEDNSYNRENYNINDNSWNRIGYYDKVSQQTGLWIYYNSQYDYTKRLNIDQSFVDVSLNNEYVTITEPTYIECTEDMCLVY